MTGNDEKQSMLDIAAGGTGAGKEYEKEHPKKEAKTPAERKAREEAEKADKPETKTA
jgi:hypothetical protein